MQYFKKTDLANTYHVSVRAVTNWIEATKKGKLDLALYEEKGKLYVANTARNIATIEKIVVERRKYRTTKAHKVITPKPEFYKTFSPDQVVDIISNLEVNREIPRQYNYFDKGAIYWDQYVQRVNKEEKASMLTGTVSLLQINQDYIDNLVRNKTVRIIDIGSGNAFPVKNLLGYLLEKGRLRDYRAVDSSPDLLRIARNNIKRWFGEKVKFEANIRDITHERFTDILSRDSFKLEGKNTVNLALLLGATLVNFADREEALKVIRHSLGREDFLIHTTGIDNHGARRYFDFNFQPSIAKLSPIHKIIFDLLNLHEDLYDVESGFDVDLKMRFIRVRLKVALSLSFRNAEGERKVDLNKGDTLLVWRAWHLTTSETLNQFENAGFELLQASVSNDGEYLLTIHRVKRASAD